MKGTTERVLQESRRRERDQTVFYRALASRAEEAKDDPAAGRIQALLADEQHHLARISARILELGGTPARLPEPVLPDLHIVGWEDDVRSRELGEVEWYVAALEEELDPETRKLLGEILESERRHARELNGKWMSA
jgi:rubrerythrin